MIIIKLKLIYSKTVKVAYPKINIPCNFHSICILIHSEVCFSLKILTIKNPTAPDIAAPFIPISGTNTKLNDIFIVVPQIVVVNNPFVFLATRYVVPKKADMFEKKRS